MEQKIVGTEEQEQTSTMREWITPRFESVPLNEALSNPTGPASDGTYGLS